LYSKKIFSILVTEPSQYEELSRLMQQVETFNSDFLVRIEKLSKQTDEQRVLLHFDRGQSSLSKRAMREHGKVKIRYKFARTELALHSIPEESLFHVVPNMHQADLVKASGESVSNSEIDGPFNEKHNIANLIEEQFIAHAQAHEETEVTLFTADDEGEEANNECSGENSRNDLESGEKTP